MYDLKPISLNGVSPQMELRNLTQSERAMVLHSMEDSAAHLSNLTTAIENLRNMKDDSLRFLMEPTAENLQTLRRIALVKLSDTDLLKAVAVSLIDGASPPTAKDLDPVILTENIVRQFLASPLDAFPPTPPSSFNFLIPLLQQINNEGLAESPAVAGRQLLRLVAGVSVVSDRQETLRRWEKNPQELSHIISTVAQDFQGNQPDTFIHINKASFHNGAVIVHVPRDDFYKITKGSLSALPGAYALHQVFRGSQPLIPEKSIIVVNDDSPSEQTSYSVEHEWEHITDLILGAFEARREFFQLKSRKNASFPVNLFIEEARETVLSELRAFSTDTRKTAPAFLPLQSYGLDGSILIEDLLHIMHAQLEIPLSSVLTQVSKLIEETREWVFAALYYKKAPVQEDNGIRSPAHFRSLTRNLPWDHRWELLECVDVEPENFQELHERATGSYANHLTQFLSQPSAGVGMAWQAVNLHPSPDLEASLAICQAAGLNAVKGLHLINILATCFSYVAQERGAERIENILEEQVRSIEAIPSVDIDETTKNSMLSSIAKLREIFHATNDL